MQAPGPPLPSVIQLAANLAREALERLRDGSQARRVARIGEPRLEVLQLGCSWIGSDGAGQLAYVSSTRTN